MSRYGSLFSEANLSGAGEDIKHPAVQAKRYQILIVDDEPNILKALKRVFHSENHVIHTAGNAESALVVLKNNSCQLIISDYMMPGMNGAELLRKTKDLYPDMIRIMLTGHADTEAVIGAIKDGAVYKFILKPWNDDDLRITAALALEKYELLQKNSVLHKQNSEKLKEIHTLTKLAVTNRSQLAIMLHKKNILNSNQLQKLIKDHETRKEPMIKLVLENGWVGENIIRGILHNDFMFEEVDLKEIQIEPAVASLLSRHICERQWVIPVKQEKKRLTIAMADPMDMGLIDDLRFNTGMEVNAVMADSASIKAKLIEMYGNSGMDGEDALTLQLEQDPYETIEIVIEDDDALNIEELLSQTEEPPAIRLVNAVVLEAIRLRASDIHIQPRAKNVVVRYRIDGVLTDKFQIPSGFYQSLVSRIKVMAELDITERRRPQDGRITVKTPMRIIDIRISTLPTVNGEKIVLRLLDRNSAVHDIEHLGLSEINKHVIRNVITKPQGIILATGPTGSGKTTTLYSMLQYNANQEKCYVTIEDPVEYYLDYAGQVLIKEKIGLDFATSLRAILRQDPDVVLVGEIRDFETAEVAFNAALTGHLVYSTLHTNSAAATIARLFDLGLKPYVVASALEGIIAQRLVRKICDHCKEEIVPSQELIYRLGTVFQKSGVRFYQGRGCSKCNNSGYLGRIGIYEILIPSEEMRNLISSNGSLLEIMRLLKEEGITTLIEDACQKVHDGITTVNEVLRVLGPQVVI